MCHAHFVISRIVSREHNETITINAPLLIKETNGNPHAYSKFKCWYSINESAAPRATDSGLVQGFSVPLLYYKDVKINYNTDIFFMATRKIIRDHCFNVLLSYISNWFLRKSLLLLRTLQI